MARNPHARLTTVQDVADAWSPGVDDSDWIAAHVINVDGGEFITG